MELTIPVCTRSRTDTRVVVQAFPPALLIPTLSLEFQCYMLYGPFVMVCTGEALTLPVLGHRRIVLEEGNVGLTSYWWPQSDYK